MKVLVLTTFFPYPQQTGFQRVSSKFIESIAVNHEVDLVSLYPRWQTEIDLDWARQKLRYVATVENPWKGDVSVFRKAIIALRLLVTRSTYQELTHHTATYERKLRQLAGNSYDLVIAEAVWLLPYGRKYWPTSRLFLHEHVMDSEQLMNRIGSTKNFPKRLALQELRRRLKRFEDEWIDRADFVIANSHIVWQQIEARFPNIPSELVPIYFDEKALDGYEPVGPGNNTLIMTGDFSFFPNEDSALFFCNEIYPAVKRRVPDIRVLFVGRAPTRRVKEAAAGKVEVVGSVSDIYSYIVRSDVVVSSIRIGGGARIKVLEAMALGMPVVATPASVVGLEAEDGVHLMIGETPDAFADKVAFLLNNRRKAREIGMTGKEFVRSRFGSKAGAEKLNALISGIGKGQAGVEQA